MEKDSRAEWRRGWPLVLAAMLGIGFGPGLFQTVSSLFIDGVTRDFGWSRGDIATAAAVGLLGGLVAPFLGRLADRIGIRPVIIASLLLLGATYVGMALQSGSLMQFQLLVVLLAFAVPGTSSVVYGKLIAACFVRHRGLALGIATSGLSATMLVMPPIVAAAIASGGWRGGYVVLAVATALVALPLVLVLLRGVPWTPTARAADDPAATRPVEGLTGAEARRDRRFWQLGASVALVNVASAGLVTQLVPLGEERGLSAGEAALLLTSYGASQVAGRVAIGALVDRFAAQRVAGVVALVSAAAFALLLLPEPGFAAMMALVFFAGLMNGAEHDLLPFLTARLFGLRAYGEVYGSLLPVSLAGTAAGIVVFGRMHDAFGVYDPALAVAVVALVLAGIAFVTLSDRDLPEVQAAAAPA
jgi:predicted MFS family arabinose efflux permease